jgi:MFS family permease
LVSVRRHVVSIASDPVLSAAALALAVNLTTGLTAPVAPLFARSLGATYSQAGLLVSSFYLARLTVDVGAGAVVDRWGEARCVAGGFALLAAGAALIALLPNYWLAVACWAVVGSGSALVYAAMFTRLLRTAPAGRVGRALTIFYSAFNGGLIAGGLVGSLIATRLGLRAPFVILAALASIAAAGGLSLIWRRPASRADVSVDRSVFSVRRVVAMLLETRAAVPVAVLFAELWGVGSVITLVPLFGRYILKLPPSVIGLLYAVFLCGEIAMLYPAGRLTDTRGRRWVLIPALAVSAVCYFLIGWLPSLALFASLLLVLSIANGFVGVPPAAMLSDVVPPQSSGLGVGAFRFGGDLGFTVAPVVVATLAGSIGFGPAFLAAGIPSALALFLVARGPETLELSGLRLSAPNRGA